MLFEYLEKLEIQFPGHTFAWDTAIDPNTFQLLNQLIVDGKNVALWVYPEKLQDLVTGNIETAEENFNASLQSFINFVTEYLNTSTNDSPPST